MPKKKQQWTKRREGVETSVKSSSIHSSNGISPSSSMAATVDKYDIYHRAFQSPREEVRNMEKFYAEVAQMPRRRKVPPSYGNVMESEPGSSEDDGDSDPDPDGSHSRTPLILREDFCGTAQISRHWCKSHVGRRAFGRMGLISGGSKVDEEAGPEVERVQLLVGDVLAVGQRGHSVKSKPKAGLPAIPRADIICSFNYAMFFFHGRSQLVEYLTVCRNYGLRKPTGPGDLGGDLMIDMFGGSSVTAAFGESNIQEAEDPNRRRGDDDGDSDDSSEQEQLDTDFSTRDAFARRDKNMGRDNGHRGAALTSTAFHAEFFGVSDMVSTHSKLLIVFIPEVHLHTTTVRPTHIHSFTYRFRVYTLLELKEALEDAGFSEVHVWIAEGVEERKRKKRLGLPPFSSLKNAQPRESRVTPAKQSEWKNHGKSRKGGDRRGGKDKRGGSDRSGARSKLRREVDDDGEEDDEEEDEEDDGQETLDEGLAEYIKVDFALGGMDQMLSYNALLVAVP
ncbi:hypothetical protein M427DRAFT_134959 [Gonapodya prolifera JEL478]|uniref:Uncharacterized protein n=1 Tax=Gonapodya prolifera (strain JEL478) TaxID=1344416 RepID=A0A139AFY2_GONPJ|nr:hypothetical protein M427DRAFT_134959 [Gonapodya prolifera JEL478]|eukprot:KXS15721.1 hypothetical protein M427DRAFT_134959 [Gonapodya prolifera JEL478]